MSRRAAHVAASLAAVSILGATACGDIETTGTQDTGSTRDTTVSVDADAAGDRDGDTQVVVDDPELAAGFVQERLGIADQWYDYDGTTHVVTPRLESYLLVRGDAAWLLRVESYYDDRGESGVFTVSSRAWDGQQWGASRRLTTAGNVKQAPVCVALDGLVEVACEGDPHELVLRTELRIVPAAGFAVGNPAIYVAGHHQHGAVGEVYRVAGTDLDAVSEAPTALGGQRAASALQTATDARIGRRAFLDDGSPRGHVYLQATGDRQLVQWQVTEASGADPRTLSVRVRCQPLADAPATQASLGDVEPSLLQIDIAAGDAAALVDLCPAQPTSAVVERLAQPMQGLWGRTDTFDLVVEHHLDGELSLLVAPGSLIWDWSAAHAGRTDFTAVEPLDSLWDD